jgi:hypothetical protein
MKGLLIGSIVGAVVAICIVIFVAPMIDDTVARMVFSFAVGSCVTSVGGFLGMMIEDM